MDLITKNIINDNQKDKKHNKKILNRFVGKH